MNQCLYTDKVVWIRIGFNADPAPAFYLNADPGSPINAHQNPDAQHREKVVFLANKAVGWDSMNAQPHLEKLAKPTRDEMR
jgi:hypothetical protein